MPVVRKVVLTVAKTCEKCKEDITAGNIALKDRTEKGNTKYFHPTCVK